MSANVGYATLQIIPSAKGFSAALTSETSPHFTAAGRSGGETMGKGFRGSFLPSLKGIAGPIAALFAADKVKNFFGSAISEARESNKIAATTAQVLKTTGGAANISAKGVNDLANSLSKKIGVDDEAIQSGENLLLTFTNIRNEAGRGNDIFNRATRTVEDMSAALGQDTKSSAIQLGKALNDPIKGVTALQRVGVSFTAQQRDQIKTLVNSGHTLTAQKLILHELGREFGGTAAATATNGKKLSVAWANLKETVGKALIPVLDKLEGGLTGLLTGQGKLGAVTRALGAAFSFLGLAWKTVVAAFQGNGLAQSSGIMGTLARVAGALGDTWRQTLLPAITSVATYVRGSLVPALEQAWQVFAQRVLPVVGQVAAFLFTKLYPATAQIVLAVGSRLKPVFDALVSVFQSRVLPAVQKIAEKFREWLPTIEKVIAVVVKVTGFVLKLAAAILGKVLPPLIKLAGFLLGAVVTAITTVIGWVVKIIGAVLGIPGAIGKAIDAVGRFLSAVKDKFGAALDFVKKVPGKIKSGLGDLSHLLLDAGKAVIQGFWNGMKAVWDKAKGFIGGIGGWIKGHKGPIEVDRVLLVPAGQAIMGGLAAGLKSGFESVKAVVAQVNALVKSIGADSARDALGAANSRFVGAHLFGDLTGSASQVKSAFDKLTAVVNDLGNDRKAAAAKLHSANDAVAKAEKALDAALASPTKTAAEAKARAARVQAARDALKAAQTAQVAASKDLEFAEANQKIAKVLHGQLAAAEKTLSGIAAKREALASQIKDATQALKDAQDQFDQYAAQVAESVTSTGSLSSVFQGTTDADGNQLPPTFASIVAGMSDAVDQAKNFQDLIGQLTAAGLDQDLITQVVQAGPQLGTAMATAILTGGAEGIAQLNALNDQMKAVADQIGQDQATALYGAGVQAAQGLLDGLKSQEAALVAEAKAIADTITQTIKSALDIHSPSRVMRAIGRQVPAGVVLGIQDGAPAVASAMAGVVAPPRVPSVSGPAPSSAAGRAASASDVVAAIEGLRSEIRRQTDRHTQLTRTGAR